MTLLVSQNELGGVAAKALIGGGVPRGVALEIASGALALHARGMSPWAMVLAALHSSPTRAATWEKTIGGWRTNTASALLDGPSIVDLAVAATDGEVDIDRLDHPALVCGIALHRELHLDGIVEASLDGGGWHGAADIADHAGPIRFRFRVQENAKDKMMAAAGALEIDEREWKALNEWAARLLVPADERSRADAGSSATDND